MSAVTHVKRTLNFLRLGPKRTIGAPPGQLAVDPEAPKPVVTLFAYGPDQLEERELHSLDELQDFDDCAVRWVNVVGLGDVATLAALQERFGLHPLAMEDTVNTHQRPKVEAYDEQVFIVVRTHYGDDLASEQIALFVRKGLLVTFHESPGDHFEPVRQRIRNNRGRIRKMDADYLAYALIDAIVDSYFPVLERLGDQLEEMEAVVFRGADAQGDVSRRINELRWNLLGIRRTIWPLREVLRALQFDEIVQLSQGTQVYLRDCADHVMQALDHVETYQQMAGALMDGYLSLASHRMNEVMKVLTMIATIFIPLSFLAGLYGMNFDTGSPFNLPELGWRYGYPVLLALMLSVAVAMLFFFKRRGWFKELTAHCCYQDSKGDRMLALPRMSARSLGVILALSAIACQSNQYLLDALDADGGSLPSGRSDYSLAVSVNETTIHRFQCTRSPIQIETEPPYLLFECPPVEFALSAADTVDMVMVHPYSGQSHSWSDLSSRHFLRMTTLNSVSTQEGDTFEAWDGQRVTVSGFDINARYVPGDDYFDP